MPASNESGTSVPAATFSVRIIEGTNQAKLPLSPLGLGYDLELVVQCLQPCLKMKEEEGIPVSHFMQHAYPRTQSTFMNYFLRAKESPNVGKREQDS
ncbi:hypothetical protein HNY73_004886 [Argiope bruennichi]|uniref:Uncharacterized protein n=1 Tax=Argiope bruennichi TaxID=94029 RepID=A0A8T0FX53_ARGBR|nr:hypothetical protein HNY73_004886 [Argiope bruennichi]